MRLKLLISINKQFFTCQIAIDAAFGHIWTSLSLLPDDPFATNSSRCGEAICRKYARSAGLESLDRTDWRFGVPVLLARVLGNETSEEILRGLASKSWLASQAERMRMLNEAVSPDNVKEHELSYAECSAAMSNLESAPLREGLFKWAFSQGSGPQQVGFKAILWNEFFDHAYSNSLLFFSANSLAKVSTPDGTKMKMPKTQQCRIALMINFMTHLTRLP